MSCRSSVPAAWVTFWFARKWGLTCENRCPPVTATNRGGPASDGPETARASGLLVCSSHIGGMLTSRLKRPPQIARFVQQVGRDRPSLGLHLLEELTDAHALPGSHPVNGRRLISTQHSNSETTPRYLHAAVGSPAARREAHRGAGRAGTGWRGTRRRRSQHQVPISRRLRLARRRAGGPKR